MNGSLEGACQVQSATRLSSIEGRLEQFLTNINHERDRFEDAVSHLLGPTPPSPTTGVEPVAVDERICGVDRIDYVIGRIDRTLINLAEITDRLKGL